MLVLDSSRADTARARHAAALYLRARCPWVDADDVLLVVSELLGNAVRHTDDGRWRLRMSCPSESLVVEVYDHSSARPVPRAGDPDNGGGFGWGIVEQLASSLTVRLHGVGKSVQAVWSAAAASRDGASTPSTPLLTA
ncbi:MULTISPECIES: ATP-binding protein [unclassified Streptomyces]|uniref:ATP-binding protein n=1 Tax=unclassified Streptomyces TaxID=2593676 RepID=UPI003647B0C8